MDRADDAGSELLYREELTSSLTTVFFAALALLIAALAAWRWRAAGLNTLAWFLVILSLFFLFYALNFRVLIIAISPQFIRLKFGFIAWQTPLEDVERVFRDQLDFFRYYGAAGLHFMVVRGRYRASFNFLEHPRVALALRRPAGPVREISLSTRQPDEIIKYVTRFADASHGKKPRRKQ